jgi:hypothetical protein
MATKTAPGTTSTRARKASTAPPAGRPQTAPRNRPVLHAVAAAEQAVRRDNVHLEMPIVGTLRLPAPDELAFIGGVAVLVMIGVVEWPVGLALGVGHALATSRRNQTVRAFGEALEAA